MPTAAEMIVGEPARVVVPYVGRYLHPTTDQLVRASGHRAIFVPLPPGDPFAYAHLLTLLWNIGESFVIVEQDMAPTSGQLSEMVRCGHRWCGHRYYRADQLMSMSFGIVRFGADVMADHPHLAEQAATIAGDPHRRTPWQILAGQFASKMLTAGESWVEHDRLVAHLHRRDAYASARHPRPSTT